MDVAFQRIAPWRKFHINTVIPLGIYLPLQTLKPRSCGAFYFLPSSWSSMASPSQVRIDAHVKPRDGAKHQDDDSPLGDLIHRHNSPFTPPPICNCRTYCERRTDRVQYFSLHGRGGGVVPSSSVLSKSGLPNPGRRS